MINTIKYYYNLNINDLKQVENDFYFDDYILKMCYRDLNIELYNYLIKQSIYLYPIIYNRNNEYITIINNKPYILLKANKHNKISLELLNKYNVPLIFPEQPDWATKWSIKVDYYEKNIENVKDETIKKSFQYYIGMTENAILLFKSLKLTNFTFLCHLRFDNDYSFYDPLNIIVDYKMRDYAEYIKEEFYKNNKYYNDFIEKIINNYHYNDVMLFFIRMLYPTQFYDAYDNYLKKEKVNYNFFFKKDKYEMYLKSIFKKISKKYNVINIDWLK